MVQAADHIDHAAPSAEAGTGPIPAELSYTRIGPYTERRCFLRALNNQMPQHHRIVDDPLARKFLSWRWRLLLPLLRFGALEAYTMLGIDRRWPGAPVYGAVRSRLIDEMLDARLRRRYDQIVVLAAGLQTRAYRSHLYPPGLRLFEVDWPEAQREKRRRVEAALDKLPENLRFVSCDITSGALLPALEAEGFEREARTIFLWEGVSFGMAADQVEATLAAVHAATLPGSVLIFDFMDGTVVYDGRTLRGSEAVKSYLAGLGMPPRFGIRPGKEIAYLRRRGYRHRRTYGPADFTLWLDTHPYFRALNLPQLWYICESIVQ